MDKSITDGMFKLSEAMQDANQIQITSQSSANNLKVSNAELNQEYYKLAEQAGDQHACPTPKFFG